MQEKESTNSLFHVGPLCTDGPAYYVRWSTPPEATGALIYRTPANLASVQRQARRGSLTGRADETPCRIWKRGSHIDVQSRPEVLKIYPH